MGEEACIADAVDAYDVISDGCRNNEEIVHLAEAGGGEWCLDDSANLLEPPRGQDVSWCSVPVATHHPRAGEAVEGEGYRLEVVKVAFGPASFMAVSEVDGSEVDPSFPHG